MSTRALLTGLLVIIAFAVQAPAQDDDIRVDARLSESTIPQDQPLMYIITVSGEYEAEVSIDFPVLKDFDNLGASTSQNFRMINYEKSVSLQYSYTLFAKAEGTFTIPAFTVKVGDREFRIEAKQVTVVKGQHTDSIIIRFVPTKRSVYVGEQFALTTEILFRVRVNTYEIVEPANMAGFIVQDTRLEEAEQDTVTLNGLEYYRFIIRREVLFPVAPGPHTISPMTLRLPYQTDRFSYGQRIATKSTAPVNIDVKPLPENAPQTFAGAVGDYAISWEFTAEKHETESPITLAVRLVGEGDIERAPDVQLNLPNSFEVINATSNSTTVFTSGRWGGEKIWEYVVIPHQAGDYTVGPLQYAHFNPYSKEYVIVSTDPKDLSIAQGKKIAAITAMPDTSPSDEADIRYIKTDPGALNRRSGHLYEQLWFWLILALPPLANAAYVIAQKIRNAKGSDTAGLRKKVALRTALDRLKGAATQSGATGVGAVESAIRRYFTDKFELSAVDISSGEIRNLLLRYDLHENPVTDALIAILNTCEAVQYAPAAAGSIDVKKLAGEAAHHLSDLDGRL